MCDSRGVVSHLDAARGLPFAERQAVAGKVIEAGRFAVARMVEFHERARNRAHYEANPPPL